MQLDQAIDEYLQWKSVETRTASKVYRPYLIHFYEFIGNKRTSEITLGDISQFRNSLKGKYNEGNIANHNNVIKNFYKYLKATYKTDIDPFLIRNPKFNPPERPVATPDEVLRMCATLDPKKFGDFTRLLAIRLMWETMIRVSELTDLSIHDIDPDKNYTEIVGKKNFKKRWIGWSGETHDMLIRYLAVRKAMNDGDALFAHNGQSINVRSVERWLKIAREKAGIEQEISCHALRHGGAHELAKNGANLKFIGLILGHSDNNPRAGMQYLRFNKEESLDVVERFVGLRFNNQSLYA